MLRGKRSFVSLLLVVLLFSLSSAASAQEGAAGTLVSGQPSIANLQAGQTQSFSYTLAEARAVTLQALGETAQPTISILANGEVIASAGNPEGDLITSLMAYLNAGSYSVQVGAANGTAGTVILVLQRESTITPLALTPGVVESGSVNLDAPIQVYSFSAQLEPAFLYVESGRPDGGTNARLLNTTSGRMSGTVSADLTGARLRIPAGSAAYQLEITHSGSDQIESYTVCLTTVSAGGCEQGAVVPVATVDVQAPVETAEVQTAACTVRSDVGIPVNIRQSASTSTAIIGALPVGSEAEVLGISPNAGFYNILFNGVNGWVSLSVVATSGDCAGVPVITPPPAVPQPTQPPAQPTLAPTQPATVTATQAPTNTPTPTQSGPCLISVVAPVNVYQIPVEQVDYLQDQVGAGGQLIPTGRLADNSWWKTNYAGSWIQTIRFGNEVTVSGDCSTLPIVAP
jgi:uncharacterized protein YraI